MFLSKTDRINPLWNFGIIAGDTKHCRWMHDAIHWHDYFEIEIIYDGKSEHILNNETYITGRGDVYILKYFDFHTHRYIDNEYAYFHNFNFNDMALPESIISLLINHTGNLYCHFEEDEFVKLLEDVDYLFEENKKTSNDAIHITMMTAIFTKIVLTILRKCKIDTDGSQLSDNSSDPFNKAIVLIQCHFKEPLTLNEIAYKVGLTPNYLGQLFIRNLGQNFSSYLRDLRLKYAKNLLFHSDYSVADVAQYSGFTSTSHFIMCFKEKYRITPKRFITTKALPFDNPVAAKY